MPRWRLVVCQALFTYTINFHYFTECYRREESVDIERGESVLKEERRDIEMVLERALLRGGSFTLLSECVRWKNVFLSSRTHLLVLFFDSFQREPAIRLSQIIILSFEEDVSPLLAPSRDVPLLES